jgi:hypothetical protein
MVTPLNTGSLPMDSMLHINLSDEQLKVLAEQICLSIKPVTDCRTCKFYSNGSCSSPEICEDASKYYGLAAIHLWQTKK